MRRTAIRLSDGRELIYFDHDQAPVRSRADERGLPAGSTEQGAMRFDVLTNEWISIAGHRQTRIFLPSASECPICPTTPGNLSEIPEPDYDVVVFENRFPSFLFGSGVPDADVVGTPGIELPAHGRCEVVVFSDDHLGSIATIDAERMSLVMKAWIDRTRELSDLAGVRYVFVFENRGAEVGVTLHHPHGQIYAYPYVPPAARTVLRSARLQREAGNGPMIRAMVDFELVQRSRIIHQSANWVAFVPYAARWPYEIQIHPLQERASLAELSEIEQSEFCEFYPRLIRALDCLFDTPFPYMSGWFQRPAHPTPEEIEHSRLFLRLISNRRAEGKLKFLAGSESLMGAFINDVPPEQAADHLRGALASAS